MSDERRDERWSPESEPRESWLERLMQRFNLRPRESVREELEEVLAEATEEAELTPQERILLTNALAFHKVRVSDVMVPRADILAAAYSATLGELMALFRAAGHSRLPVYGSSLDEPLGMVHIRDLLDFIAAHGATEPSEPDQPPKVASLAGVDLSLTIDQAKLKRDVLFVPGSMPALDLLARMQASRTHMALVIDEYGGTDGLVTIEDLLETVVGDIEDEHDVATDMIVREERGDIVADARATLDEVSEAIGQNLSAADDVDDVHTLGGLVVTRAGRVPRRGEVIEGPDGFSFEVLDADPRRLKRIRIRRPASPDDIEADRWTAGLRRSHG
ncbi:hemolysin family protein [Enterovirga aerilata]|uniref:HlyC/CorC family transporter n=1 Tax=Enterovirga aerilata TaxID=2730920 RepID=A0A849I9B3_9HYPH|nr:hemolysin family protein [Enterovirga sp. DB1703]NNM74404.1 HlyC/CorC family transporter [Enterovirga sp. DB1703]